MRPYLGGCQILVLGKASLERRPKIGPRRPARAISNRELKIQQAARHGRGDWRQLLDVSTTSLGDQLAVAHELDVPHRNGPTTLSGFERRIPLAQRLLVALPVLHERMFHVEHSPVDEATPTVGTLLDQAMDLGVDDLYRQHPSKLSQG